MQNKQERPFSFHPIIISGKLLFLGGRSYIDKLKGVISFLQKYNVQHRHTRGAQVRFGQRLGSGDVAQVAIQPAGQDARLHHPCRLRQARGKES